MSQSTEEAILKYILGTTMFAICIVILVISVTANYMAPTNTVEIPNPYNAQHVYDEWSFPNVK